MIGANTADAAGVVSPAHEEARAGSPVRFLMMAGSARADEVAMRDVAGPMAHPGVVKSERACNEGKETGLARTKSLTLPGARAEILHECGGVPAGSMLALETDARWFVADGFTIEDIGANMSDPRFHHALVEEYLDRGTFADGSSAVVYRSISRHDMVTKSGQVVDSQLVEDVMICSVKDSVHCGRIAYTCPSTGCGPGTLVRGVLSTVERRQYTYEP